LPLVKDGAAIARTKAGLIALLVMQGHEIISEADAHTVVDGLRIDPIRLSDTRFAFMLPDGGQQIVLRSNTFVPAHAVAESSDLRELGLCISRLLINGSALALDDDETCAIGWFEGEVPDGRNSHRWTTGATPLPAGARIVIIDISGDGHYWRIPENNAAARYG
jgi:hypothetical protein